MEVNVHEAKTHLSRLLQRVAGGEEITIARSGVPVAKLVPVEARGEPRRLGLARGRFKVPEDFDAPLPADLLAAFEGETAERGKAGRGTRRSGRK